MKVAIFFGSKSDMEIMRGAANCLKEFGISYKAYVLSAHRVPEKLEETLRDIEAEDCEVIIAGAGLAAHLPGVIASQTVIPVIGIPCKGAIEGLDALFSIVQMLSIGDKELKAKLIKYRKDMKEKFIAENGEGVDL